MDNLIDKIVAYIKKLGKKDLLILDDFGTHPLTPEARLALLKT